MPAGLEGREGLVDDLSETSVECINTLEAIVDFVEPLVHHTTTTTHLVVGEGGEGGRGDSRQQRDQRDVLRTFLLSVCERPLAFLHQETVLSGNFSPNLEIFCEFVEVFEFEKRIPRFEIQCGIVTP